jgi:uncharacterized protein
MEALCRLSYSSDARHDTRGVRATMDRMRPPAILTLGALLLLCSAASCRSSCDVPPARVSFRTGTGSPSLIVDVARTPSEREQGLMGRTSLAPDHGMAFLYGAPSSDGFWMKDTHIPLSIAFWGRDGRIQQIFDMTPCTSDPCRVYRADATFRGAVEAPRGYFERHGIHVGDRVEVHVMGCI